MAKIPKDGELEDLTQVNDKIASIEQNHEQVLKRLNDILARFDLMNNRLNNLEGNQAVERLNQPEQERIGRELVHHNERPRREEPNRQENLPKAIVPPFSGKSGVDDYLQWKDKMKRLFILHHYAGPRQVDIAISEFTDYAATWWEQSEKRRETLGHPRANNWDQLVRVMDAQFIPKTY